MFEKNTMNTWDRAYLCSSSYLNVWESLLSSFIMYRIRSLSRRLGILSLKEHQYMYVAGYETRTLLILGYQSLFPLPSGSLLTFMLSDTCFWYTKHVFYKTNLCKKILFIWLNNILKNITEYTHVCLWNKNYFSLNSS